MELARGELDEAQHGREPWAGFILRGASAGKWASSGFWAVMEDVCEKSTRQCRCSVRVSTSRKSKQET